MGLVIEWTDEEQAILVEFYPAGGVEAVQAEMARRGLRIRPKHGMYKRAARFKLRNESPRSHPKEKQQPDEPWSLPTMTLIESLDCVRLRDWAPNVEPGQPAWRVA